MAEFTISDNDLESLKDQVIVVTGCSSGIGLAFVELALSQGSCVVGGDLNDSPVAHQQFTFVKTDVTSWKDLSALFKRAKQDHGKVDHAFANAGIGGRTTYLDSELDENGDLLEPSHQTFDVNLKGVVNTATLAIHYMRRQEHGGSIVITSSASCFQPFANVDYAAAKHAVFGLMRGLVPSLQEVDLPIRVNAIAPSWTLSGLVPMPVAKYLSKPTQSAEVPARSAAILMADKSRNGQLIYSYEGKFKDVEQSILLPAARQILGDGPTDNEVLAEVRKARRQSKV